MRPFLNPSGFKALSLNATGFLTSTPPIEPISAWKYLNRVTKT
jgi:hypothetical protein